MEHLRHAIRIAVNAVQQIRDAVYLDTNAWSLLAKGHAPVQPLARWTERNGCFLCLSRMQVAELSAQRSVVEGLANVLSHVGVVLVDRGQNEFRRKAVASGPLRSSAVPLLEYCGATNGIHRGVHVAIGSR